MIRRIAAAALAILGLYVFAAPVSAQQFPNKAVTIIVPFAPGGPTDATAREVANFLTKKTGQSFIVENISGGSTIIATGRLAHATPDGYTLLMHNLQIAANVTLFKTLPFDTEKTIVPVMLVNQNPLVFVGRPGLAPNNLKELLALMKKERLKEALPGIGTTGHLTSALFAQEAGVQIDFIPYRGAAPAMNDLIGGHVDLFVGTPQSVVSLVESGKLKAYAITSKEKSARMPNAESLVDALGPQFDIVFWQGLFAPAGTPDNVLAAINALMQEAVADPSVLKAWDGQGFAPFPKDKQTIAAANALMKSEIARWGKIIRDNKIEASP